MPVPIQRINDNNRSSAEMKSESGNFYMDFSFLQKVLPQSKKIVTASDKDADILIRLWSSSDKIDEDVYNIKNSKVSTDDVLRLKTHGFLTGGSEEVKFTGKARAVITTMVLGETNVLQKEQKKKSYTEILASMNLKGKKGYRMPTYASNTHLLQSSPNK